MYRSIFYIFILLVLVSVACESQETPTSVQWQRQLEPALESARTMPRLYSLLISHNGKLVLEHYFNGKKANDIANIKSVSKSVISALVGIAIEQGYIQSVDATIGQYFVSQIPDRDLAKRQIKIEDLLTMRSGLETTSNRNYGAWVLSDNWIEFVLHQPLQRTPGTGMQYSTGSTHLLSAIITRTSGTSTLEFARKYLTGNLDFHLSSWPTDPQGIYFGGNDMEMTPRQMLAFGELYLNEGRYKGKQVVPSEWVAKSFKPKAVSRWDRQRYYGYGWWIREMAGHTVPYAWGYGGQFIMLVPDLELVIVSTANSLPGDGRRYHTRRMYDLVEDLIIQPLAASIEASEQTQTSNQSSSRVFAPTY